MFLCFSNMMMWHVLIGRCKPKDFTPIPCRILFSFQYYLVLSCNLWNSQHKSCNLVTLGTANSSHTNALTVTTHSYCTLLLLHY